MPTTAHTLRTTTARNISTLAGMENGKTYHLQALGGTIRYAALAAAPDDDDLGTTPAFKLSQHGTSDYEAASGESLFAWAEGSRSAQLIVSGGV